MNKYENWEQHLQDIIEESVQRMTSQYTKGQQENGDNLWAMPAYELAEESLSEAIDAVVYGIVLIHQLRDKDDHIRRLEQYIEELETVIAGAQG